jgi:uncharacterized metal-binding protein
METKQPNFGHQHLQSDRTDFAAYSGQSITTSSRNRTTIFAGAPASNTARVAPAIAEYNINATKCISPIVASAASASAASVPGVRILTLFAQPPTPQVKN